MNPIPIDILEIIAFADAFELGTLPRIVAPIFRLRGNHDAIVFPPFKLADQFVIGAQEGDADELERMVSRGMATMLPKPRNPLPNSVLWVENGVDIYESSAEHARKWKEGAVERLNEAIMLLQQKDFPAAKVSARHAFALDESRFEAIALQVAVARHQGKPKAEAALTRIGHELAVGPLFDAAVRNFMQEYMPKQNSWSGIFGQPPVIALKRKKAA